MSTISAGNTLTTGFVQTSDTTGNLVFQTNGTTTALTLNTSQNATLVGTLNTPNTFGFKNRIINGGMVIDQRNAGASVTPTNGAYTLDRWSANLTQASKFTVQQSSTAPTGFANSLKVTSSSAYSVVSGDYFAILQCIEAQNITDFAFGTANAKTVTLSFWVYSSLTGTFGGAARNYNADRSYPFSYTINSANTWEQKTVTFAGDTTGTWNTTGNSGGLFVIFSLGAGTTLSGTANTWQTGNYIQPTGSTSVLGTNGATLYISGVQLEIGSQATSFDFRDYGRELLLCQRYYQKLPSFQAATSYAAETTLVGAPPLWVVMRTDPTATLNGSPQFHKPGIAFYNITSITSAPNANGGSYTGMSISSGAGTGVSGQAIAPILLSAEL